MWGVGAKEGNRQVDKRNRLLMAVVLVSFEIVGQATCKYWRNCFQRKAVIIYEPCIYCYCICKKMQNIFLPNVEVVSHLQPRDIMRTIEERDGVLALNLAFLITCCWPFASQTPCLPPAKTSVEVEWNSRIASEEARCHCQCCDSCCSCRKNKTSFWSALARRCKGSCLQMQMQQVERCEK